MEENWIYAAFPVLGKVVITVILIFSTIIFFTRISGLCTFAKMSSFDFASTIAIGSILASVIMNTNQSLLKGAVALGSIITFQSIFTFLARKSKPARKFMTNDPMMLMYQGEILWDNLDKTNVGEDDLMAKIREANVIHMDQVLAIILESTGDKSVLHSSEHSQLDRNLLKSVAGIPEKAFLKGNDLVS